MKLIASEATDGVAHEAHDHGAAESDGLEWEDLMPDINRQTDANNMIWKLIDRDEREAGSLRGWLVQEVDAALDAGDSSGQGALANSLVARFGMSA